MIHRKALYLLVSTILLALVLTSCVKEKVEYKYINNPQPADWWVQEGDYISQRDIEDARNAFWSIYVALQLFKEDLGEYPPNLNSLLWGGYYNPDRGLVNKWTFRMDTVRYVPVRITATYNPTCTITDSSWVEQLIYCGDYGGYTIYGPQWEFLHNIEVRPTPPQGTDGYYSWLAQRYLRSVYNTAIMYTMDLGDYPPSFEALITGGYLAVDTTASSIMSQWNITLHPNHNLNYLDSIVAISTPRMPDDSGRVVTYHLANNQFTGYGIYW